MADHDGLRGRGDFARAEEHFRRAIATLTQWNFNPYDVTQQVIGRELVEVLEILGEPRHLGGAGPSAAPPQPISNPDLARPHPRSLPL